MAKVDPHVEEQFLTGRLYGEYTSDVARLDEFTSDTRTKVGNYNAWHML